MANELDQLLPFLLNDTPLNERRQQQFLKLFKHIQKTDPEDRTAEEWFVLAYAFESRNDEMHAVEYYTKAIEANPDFEAAYKNRGAAFIQLKEFDDAQFDLGKALELDPSYIEADYELAVLYAEQDDTTKALEKLDRILDKKPEYVNALAQKGSILDRKKLYSEALTCFDKAIKLAPDNANLYSQRAISRLFASDAPGAEKDFQKAQQLAGANYITLFNLGLAVGLQPDKSKPAYQYFEKAFRKQPDLLSTYFRDAKAYESDRLGKKINDLIESLKKIGDDQPGRYYRDELIDLLGRKLEEAGNKKS